MSSESRVKLGPTRLPILLRISEFADALQKARGEGRTLAIADFIGSHSGLRRSNSGPNLPKEGLNALFRHYLGRGEAVVILDGMDEITASSQRADVVEAIETFIDNWIIAQGRQIGSIERAVLRHQLTSGDPAEIGGNQILITSRIVGYQSAPLRGEIVHVEIQPMSELAVRRFCASWTRAVAKENTKATEAEIEATATAEASSLTREIFNPSRPRVRQLAANPLLITILALLHRRNRGTLPQQRVEIYDRAMHILFQEWRHTGISEDELVYVLSPLAAHIHQQSARGTIEASEMKERIRGELARYRALDPRQLPPSFKRILDEFVEQVRSQVGIIAEQTEGLYGFLHLTFQEYLAARYLVREPNSASKQVVSRLDDARWREPILLALGYISLSDDWGPVARKTLLTDLLNADDPLGDILPRSALLIADALPEMARVPREIVIEIVRKLVVSYADRHGLGQFETLREQIEQALHSVHEGIHRDILERTLGVMLDNIADQSALGLAAARLINKGNWQSETLLGSMIRALPYDSADWGFPITDYLHRQIVADFSLKPPPLPRKLADLDSEIRQIHRTLGEVESHLLESTLEEELRGYEAAFPAAWEAYVSEQIQHKRELQARIRSGEEKVLLGQLIELRRREELDRLTLPPPPAFQSGEVSAVDPTRQSSLPSPPPPPPPPPPRLLRGPVALPSLEGLDLSELQARLGALESGELATQVDLELEDLLQSLDPTSGGEEE